MKKHPETVRARYERCQNALSFQNLLFPRASPINEHRYRSALHNKRSLKVHRAAQTERLKMIFFGFDKPVKPETIFSFIDTFDELPGKFLILRLIERALEHGLLHSLAKVLAHLRQPAKTMLPLRRFCRNVVCDQNQHEIGYR
jgi:hypothetical protein